MDFYLYDWLALVFRWFHIIAAIAWIGASFYFVWLDNSLEMPSEKKKESGIKGDLWAFHGGGIYEVAKYKLAPQKMPSKLHWFKWEAYTTWITGSILLCIMYYVKADLYLVSPNSIFPNTSLAIFSSLLFIASGVAVYELLFRFCSMKFNRLMIFGVISYIAFSCYFSTVLFSERAAFLHVGALIASIMAANVFFGIIPTQKEFIKQISLNEEPQEKPMLQAKLRSVHNNYFTLPVIFCMSSNHYSFIYGHPLNWLILICILGLTAYVRHYFNLKHQGQHKPHILIFSVFLLGVLTIGFSASRSQTSKAFNTLEDQPHIENTENTQENSILLSLAKKHCMSCHHPKPTQVGFSSAPAGLNLHTLESIKLAKDSVREAVQSNYMPLGNITQMTEMERKTFIDALEKNQ